MREIDVEIGALALDCGETLPAVRQRVTIYGQDDAVRTVFVAHALTGSSRVGQWWPAIAGPGGLFDPAWDRIIGINVLGGCYGSTPTSLVSVRDIVQAQMRALDALGIERIDVAIGGSLGGMQALQWALDAPERVGEAIVVGTHDHFSAMGVAFNAIQRECLDLDPVRGLRVARKLAMLTYKSEALFNARHDRRRDRNDPSRFDIEGYLDLQADRFAGRMDARAYVALTRAMDGFDVRGRTLQTRATFVGISSDWLFRACDVRAAAERMGGAYVELKSDHGHDAFLAEASHLASLLTPTLFCRAIPSACCHPKIANSGPGVPEAATRSAAVTPASLQGVERSFASD